jgi:hypothetical protein
MVPLFSTTELVRYEPSIEHTMELLFSQLDESASRGQKCDFGSWIEWFLWDTLALIMLSKKFGFLEIGEDVDNIVHDVAKQSDYSSLVRSRRQL